MRMGAGRQAKHWQSGNGLPGGGKPVAAAAAAPAALASARVQAGAFTRLAHGLQWSLRCQ